MNIMKPYHSFDNQYIEMLDSGLFFGTYFDSPVFCFYPEEASSWTLEQQCLLALPDII